MARGGRRLKPRGEGGRLRAKAGDGGRWRAMAGEGGRWRAKAGDGGRWRVKAGGKPADACENRLQPDGSLVGCRRTTGDRGGGGGGRRPLNPGKINQTRPKSNQPANLTRAPDKLNNYVESKRIRQCPVVNNQMHLPTPFLLFPHLLLHLHQSINQRWRNDQIRPQK